MSGELTATAPAGRRQVYPARGGPRLIALGVLLAIALALLLFPAIHDRLLHAIAGVGDLIRQRPAVGMLAFVLLAALSAMLAFVSSAVLIPVAVHVWGPLICAILLWVGWFLGGLAAYAAGRYLGRPIVERLVRPGTIAHYETWARSGATLVPILLLQLAVPSDVAGYVFGLVRCRFLVFLAALAVAEVPYALGAVYLGVSFLEGKVVPLMMLGIGGALLSGWAFRRLHRVHSMSPVEGASRRAL